MSEMEKGCAAEQLPPRQLLTGEEIVITILQYKSNYLVYGMEPFRH